MADSNFHPSVHKKKKKKLPFTRLEILCMSHTDKMCGTFCLTIRDHYELLYGKELREDHIKNPFVF